MKGEIDSTPLMEIWSKIPTALSKRGCGFFILWIYNRARDKTMDILELEQAQKYVELTDRIRKAKRENMILYKLSIGHNNTEIADDLSISYNTVKTHIYNIYKKINVESRSEATLWASRYFL